MATDPSQYHWGEEYPHGSMNLRHFFVDGIYVDKSFHGFRTREQRDAWIRERAHVKFNNPGERSGFDYNGRGYESNQLRRFLYLYDLMQSYSNIKDVPVYLHNESPSRLVTIHA